MLRPSTLKRVFAAFAVLSLIGFTSSAAWSQPKDIRWGTGPVGSSGHKALVVLANLLNKEMPKYDISVLPIPGAVDDGQRLRHRRIRRLLRLGCRARRNSATDSGRFKGFKSHVKRQPVQSFWAYTLDVGLAIKASNTDKIKKWTDLTGKRVYTGPLPFDTRLKLENAMAAVGVKHIYTQVDLATAGSQLDSGRYRRHDHLRRRRQDTAAVDLAGLACRRLGGAQSERRTRSPS